MNINVIDFLQQRQSTPVLTEPAPSNDDLNKILAAGMRVPDHAGLKPWHFTVITESGLQRLSDLFVEAITNEALSTGDISTTGTCTPEFEAKKVKTSKMPFRAPLIIVIATSKQTHEKVPMLEQQITAGCCAHAMQMAASSLGYGAMWRTGTLAYDSTVKAGLNVSDKDDIVGFLYIGTPCREHGIKPSKSMEGHVTYWK